MNKSIDADINCDVLSGVYSEIAEVIGVEKTYDIFKKFKGLQITFPSRFYDTRYVVECLRNEYDGTNVKELARKYSYSESRIRQLVKDVQK